MADFRKWLYAFAGVTLLAGLSVPASAQGTQMSCKGSANNPLIRAEEYTAMAGDVFVNCTGGIPTQAGTAIPKATITIFVANTAITSRITQTSSEAPAWNEALLIMDGAGEALNSAGTGPGLLNCGNTAAPFQTTPADETCNISSHFGDGTGDYDGTPGRPNVFQGRQVDNSFGQAIQFIGVPIDPPGSNGLIPPTRVMRFTNLRVNAVALNVYNLGNSFSLTTINTTVSFNGTNFGGSEIFTVPNGTVRIGLVVSAGKPNAITTCANTEANPDADTCTTFNGGVIADLASPPATFLQCNAEAGFAGTSILLSEGFPTAFKVKNFAEIQSNGGINSGEAFYHWVHGSANLGSTAGDGTTQTSAGPIGDINQNVPSALYNTESGIMNSAAFANPTPNPPAGTGSNFPAPPATPFNNASNGTGIEYAGTVSQGTRFVIHFSSVPIGSNPSVPLTVELHTGPVTSDIDTGVLRLVCGTDSHGQGGTQGSCTAPSAPSSTSPGSIGSPITLDANGNGFVIYEVAFADPNALEYANVPVYVNPAVAINATTPTGGTPQVGVAATATAGFAPFYTTNTSGVGAAQKLTSSFPIPRFVDNALPATPISIFVFGKCACDMLFPWVVGNSAINTSIVVANTSLDPCGGTACAAGFTAAPQPGKVKFWFFGTNDFNFDPTHFAPGANPGQVIAPQTSVSVPAGSYIAFVISPSSAVAGTQTSSNGLGPTMDAATGKVATPFAGYVIAQSEFQFCHGIASLSGVGLTPQTYLGLVLDKSGGKVNGAFAFDLQRTNQAFADQLEN